MHDELSHFVARRVPPSSFNAPLSTPERGKLDSKYRRLTNASVEVSVPQMVKVDPLVKLGFLEPGRSRCPEELNRERLSRYLVIGPLASAKHSRAFWAILFSHFQFRAIVLLRFGLNCRDSIIWAAVTVKYV